MGIPAGPRGYPGSQGLTGATGSTGEKGAPGQGATVVDNGNNTYTVTGANGAVIVRDGAKPVKGVDFYDGRAGDYVVHAYAKVPNGAPPPTTNLGTGSYDGINTVMPTGSHIWLPSPGQYANHTVYVVTNWFTHDNTTGGQGTWSLRNFMWTEPTIWNKSAGSQFQLVSYAFSRSNTPPSVPEGGTYYSPTPTTSGWSDGIPAGTLPVYMTKRLFTSDAEYPQDSTWTTPYLLGSSGVGTRFKFGPTNLGPWNTVPSHTDEWMIACTVEPDGSLVCDVANPIKIKGEQGEVIQTAFKAFAYKRAPGALVEIPEGGTFTNPAPVDGLISGWTDYIPEGSANLHVSNRLFTSDGLYPQDSNWSISQLFSGQNATSFVISADSQVFSYDSDGELVAPNEITITAVKQNISEPTNWTTVPDITASIASNALDSDTYVITGEEFGSLTNLKVIATAGGATDETTLVRVSDGHTPVGGIDYNDGVSVYQSRVYKAGPPGGISAPTANTGSWDGTTEVMPGGGWVDDPLDPPAGQFVYESHFTYFSTIDATGKSVWIISPPNGGVWSTPTKYSYIPTQGIDYTSGNSFQSYIFRNEVVGVTPGTPINGSYDGTTEIFPSAPASWGNIHGDCGTIG